MIEAGISAVLIVLLFGILAINLKINQNVITKSSFQWMCTFFHKNSSLLSTIGVFTAVLTLLYQPESFKSLDNLYLMYLKIVLWMLNIVLMFLLFIDILKDLFKLEKVKNKSALQQFFMLTIVTFIIWIFLSILLRELFNLFSDNPVKQLVFLSNFIFVPFVPFIFFGKVFIDKFGKKEKKDVTVARKKD